jgi:hypothetical protein
MPPRGSRSLIGAFYAQLTRRPKRRPYALIVLESEPGQAGKIVTAYEARLKDTVVRIARAEVRDDRGDHPDVASLLDHLRDDLSLGGRGLGWRRRGFPRFETCRTALTHRTDPVSVFIDALYENFARRHAFIRALANESKGVLSAVLLVPVRLLLQEPVQQGLYKLWLGRTRSLRWVMEVNHVHQDFVSYVRTGPDDEIAELHDRILVEAFLRDLEWQLRSSIYSVGRWRRQPIVLLMSRPPTCQAERTFIEQCARVLGAQGRQRADAGLRKTPVQVVAAVGHDTGLDISKDNIKSIKVGSDALEAASDALADAAKGLAPTRSLTRGTGSSVVLWIPVPSASSARETPEYPPSRLRRHWYDYVFPMTSTLATAAVLALLGLLVTHPPWDHGACSGTWVTSTTHERVGITDGNCPLSDGKPLLNVERKIAAQNRQVQSMIDQDPRHRPFQTVVLFSPLTVSPGDVGENSLDEARGVQLAQADAIEQAKDDGSEIPVKMLLANSGDRIAEAPQVATDIVKRANSDQIGAVIGISQSRAEAHQAIQTLSNGTKVPIIGSVTTGDRMLDSSPRYYEIVPRNLREAETIAQFLDHQPVMAGPHGERILVKDVVVVEDPRDEYSQNLAEDFRHSFTAPGHHTVTFDYGPPGEGLARDPEHIGDIPEPSADQLVHDMCKTIGDRPDMVFYASRAQQLLGVLDKFDSEPACHGRELGIMGTDEDTRFIADGTLKPSNYPAVNFYNASFSNLTNPPTLVADQFISEYRRTYGTSPGDSGAADAYDAFTAAWHAINLAYQQDKTIPPDTISAKMADGLVSFTGATGLITFNGAHDTTRVPHDKPIFVMVEQTSGRPTPLLACGQYAEDREWSAWGTGKQKFPCPHDPSP